MTVVPCLQPVRECGLIGLKDVVACSGGTFCDEAGGRIGEACWCMGDVDAATDGDGERVLREDFAENARDFGTSYENVIRPFKLGRCAGMLADDFDNREGNNEADLRDDCDFRRQRKEQCGIAVATQGRPIAVKSALARGLFISEKEERTKFTCFEQAAGFEVG